MDRKRIKLLRELAADAGDNDIVDNCDLALKGDAHAIELCERQLDELDKVVESQGENWDECG